jgi:hypothetical protein
MGQGEAITCIAGQSNSIENDEGNQRFVFAYKIHISYHKESVPQTRCPFHPPAILSQLIRSEVIEPRFEFLNAHLLIRIRCSTRSLRRDENRRHDVDHSILSKPIRDGNATKPVDQDPDEASPSRNIDAQTLVLQQCRQINMIFSLRELLGVDLICSLNARIALSFVEGVGVEGLVGNDVVLEEGLEVFLAVFAEQEGVDLRAEFLEC